MWVKKIFFGTYNRLLKATDVARVLRCSRAQAYRLFARPDFPSMRVSGTLYVYSRDLHRWLNEQREDKRLARFY